jgi:signal transduction histidine kinase
LKVSALVTLRRQQTLGAQERRRAERLEALGTLAAGLAHEIRNPLNSALLKLQVLERRLRHTDRADPLEVVDTIRGELGRVDHLLSDFLAFAEPVPLDVARVDLNELLADLAASFTATAESQGVDVERELDPELGTLELDVVRFRGVLAGLVDNALEAMPHGGTLRLRTRAADADGFARVEVEDTGAGFPSDAPIFDPFYTTKASGTGLGLSIAHRVLSDHGGRILAQASPGRTLFTLYLPS